jgi:hypothetical protein
VVNSKLYLELLGLHLRLCRFDKEEDNIFEIRSEARKIKQDIEYLMDEISDTLKYDTAEYRELYEYYRYENKIVSNLSEWIIFELLHGDRIKASKLYRVAQNMRKRQMKYKG